jgi:hypothetical protein
MKLIKEKGPLNINFAERWWSIGKKGLSDARERRTYPDILAF